MDANKALRAKYEKILANIDEDMAQAQRFIDDLKERYDKGGDIDEVIKIQTMIMKIADLLSNKRIQRTEIERQMEEFTKK